MHIKPQILLRTEVYKKCLINKERFKVIFLHACYEYRPFKTTFWDVKKPILFECEIRVWKRVGYSWSI
jgi:hypothetical protein